MVEESTGVPKARLSQIAARKLSALGIPHHLKPDQETLEGELSFSSPLVHPVTRGDISTAGFVVIGHNRLSLTEPPLAGLEPVIFYDAEDAANIEERIRVALAERLRQLEALSVQMKARGLVTTLDADRLLLQAKLEAGRHHFELVAAPDGIRVEKVVPPQGKSWEVGRAQGRLELSDAPTAQALELHLLGALEAWRKAGHVNEESAPEAPKLLTALAPAPAALTTGALQRFGPGATLHASADGLLVTQDFQLHEEHYQFSARHQQGTFFLGKLVATSGEKWSARFDCEELSGLSAWVAKLLEVSTGPAGQAAPESASASVPAIGELWVMEVLIEQEANGEVRYVGTDIAGKPYGAPRILKRSDFERVFVQGKSGWRLRIQVDRTQGDTVTYHSVGNDGKARAGPRSISAAILVATFVRESSAPAGGEAA